MSDSQRRELTGNLRTVEYNQRREWDELRRARAGALPCPDYDPDAYIEIPEPGQISARLIADLRLEFANGHGLSREELASKYRLGLRKVYQLLSGEDTRKHCRCKLSADQVREILRRYRQANGRRGIMRRLAQEYGVNKSTISDIVRGQSWHDIAA
jgi:hypothetical protein